MSTNFYPSGIVDKSVEPVLREKGDTLDVAKQYIADLGKQFLVEQSANAAKSQKLQTPEGKETFATAYIASAQNNKGVMQELADLFAVERSGRSIT